MFRAIVLIAALSMLGPGDLLAQSDPDRPGPGLGADQEVGAALSLRLGATRLGPRTAPIGGVTGTVRLSRHLEVGGDGVVTLRAVPVSQEAGPGRLDATVGYGGLLIRWRPADDLPGIRWGVSLTAGAGTVRTRSSLVPGTIGSTTFLFIEPAAHLLFRQDRTVRFSADAGYRIDDGSGPLPGTDPGWVRGPVVSLSVHLVRNP